MRASESRKVGKRTVDEWYWLDCDYMSGAIFSYENGKKHLFYGGVAGTQEDYGIGVSHFVLGIEEIIKSLLLVASYIYPYLLSTDEKKNLFLKHDYKHSNVKEFLLALSVQNIETYHENPFDDRNNNKFQTIAHFLNKGLQLGSLQPEEVKQLLDLMDKANVLKNCGFYVDYKAKWIIPSEIGKKQFSKYQILAKRILGYIEPIFTIPITDERFQRFIDGTWV